jgi:hypothetical protein
MLDGAVENGEAIALVQAAGQTMPRISHKKASTLSCAKLHAATVTRLAEQVAEEIVREIDSRNGSQFFSCTVSDAVTRLLPTITCPLQPNELLQRCTSLDVPHNPPPPQIQSNNNGEIPCVASCAAAYTIMWSLLLEGVGDVAQRGLLRIMASSAHRLGVLRAGHLVLKAVELPEEQDGAFDGQSVFAGLPASIDLLLADEIGGKVLSDNRGHVIKLLSQCARSVLYQRGSVDAVDVNMSPAGDLPCEHPNKLFSRQRRPSNTFILHPRHHLSYTAFIFLHRCHRSSDGCICDDRSDVFPRCSLRVNHLIARRAAVF